MGLLNHLPLNGPTPPDGQAVAILRGRLAQREVGTRSLCELRPDQADFAWLKDWAASLRPERLNIAGWHVGALVTLLAAEAARRDAQEGHVWPVLFDRFRIPATRDRLFTSNDQPTPPLALFEVAIIRRYAPVQSLHRTSACSKTSSVARACLSGGKQ